jgi:hypothetical protein
VQHEDATRRRYFSKYKDTWGFGNNVAVYIDTNLQHLQSHTEEISFTDNHYSYSKSKDRNNGQRWNSKVGVQRVLPST